MKKFIVAILALVMLLAVAVSASASPSKSFELNVPCQAISDDQLYNYFYDSYLTKQGINSNTIQVAHEVTQTSADETNRIAAYREDTQKTMGANWHPSDRALYPCTSNMIKKDFNYSVAGRGNTNYKSKYGLNTITLDGYFKTDLD